MTRSFRKRVKINRRKNTKRTRLYKYRKSIKGGRHKKLNAGFADAGYGALALAPLVLVAGAEA